MNRVRVMLLLLCVAGLMSCQRQLTADEVVHRVTEAAGGAARLAEIVDQVSTWDFTMHVMPPDTPEGMTGPMTMPMTITAKRPNKLRFDTYDEQGRVVSSQCFDGTAGWNMQMGQKMDMPEAQVQEYETMASTWLDGFVDYQEKGLAVELLDNEAVDNQQYWVLQVTDKHGNAQKYYVNPETHFIERQSGEMYGMEGHPVTMTMVLRDYTVIDGVAWAHHVAQHDAEGNLIWEARLKDVRQNTAVDDAVFVPGADSVSVSTE